MRVIDKFPAENTLHFFEGLGILPKNRNGYIYPNSEQAAAVLDSLQMELVRLGVSVECGCDVKHIFPLEDGSFDILTSLGTRKAQKVILAAGSKAAPVTGSDGSGYRLAEELGHVVVMPLPALVQLRCDGKYFKQVSGVRCEAGLRLLADGKELAADTGELQLTDYGISGIPTFQISRFASVALYEKRNVTVSVDFLPSRTFAQTEQLLMGRIERFQYRNSGELLIGMFNKKLALMLIKQAGVRADMRVSDVPLRCWDRLLHLIKEFSIHVTAVNSYEQAQVCCGGVDTAHVNETTMESNLIKNLYFAGEILDVDGICGGYNLQWAWSTGMIAGKNAGRTS